VENQTADALLAAHLPFFGEGFFQLSIDKHCSIPLHSLLRNQFLPFGNKSLKIHLI